MISAMTGNPPLSGIEFTFISLMLNVDINVDMSQGSLMPNMNSIHLKIKDLQRYHCSCHGNLVAVAMKYAADAYCPKEA